MVYSTLTIKNTHQSVNGTCNTSVEAGDELGTTRMSKFRVISRVTVGVFGAEACEVSLRAMEGGGRGGGRSQLGVCLVINTGYLKFQIKQT